MQILPPKDPHETVRYRADWERELGGDLIATYTLTVTSGHATIERSYNSTTYVDFFIAGGTNGSTTTFRLIVTTNTGQIFERNYSLYVATGVSFALPATTTKGKIVEQAFVEIALNGWEYDITPEEKDIALTRLDALMAELASTGVSLGYNAPVAIGSGSLNDAAGVPDGAFMGIATLLAHRLCSSMGKALSRESRETLAQAKRAVYACATTLVPQRRLASGTPVGAGNKPFGLSPFTV